HERQHHHDLLTECHVDSTRLRSEYRRDREVQRASVEVERISRWHHERHDARRNAHRFHVLHRQRKRCFGGRSRERNQRGCPYGAKECLEGNARENRYRQQHDEREYDQRAVQRCHELAEAEQHADTAMTDCDGECCTNTDRCIRHHDLRELEHQVRGRGAEVQHQFLLFALLPRERYGEQNREEYDLQNFVMISRFEEALRNHVLQHATECNRVRRKLGPGGRGRAAQRHADPRLEYVDRGQSDNERAGRHELEIDQRPQREAPHLGHVVAVAGNAHHERGEDQRYDQRLYHAQEDLRQWIELDRERREGDPDDDPHYCCDDNPLRQRDAPQTAPRVRALFRSCAIHGRSPGGYAASSGHSRK